MMAASNTLPPLTVAGKWAVALLAEVVGIFAIWQYIGLRRAVAAD